MIEKKTENSGRCKQFTVIGTLTLCSCYAMQIVSISTTKNSFKIKSTFKQTAIAIDVCVCVVNCSWFVVCIAFRHHRSNNVIFNLAINIEKSTNDVNVTEKMTLSAHEKKAHKSLNRRQWSRINKKKTIFNNNVIVEQLPCAKRKGDALTKTKKKTNRKKTSIPNLFGEAKKKEKVNWKKLAVISLCGFLCLVGSL